MENEFNSNDYQGRSEDHVRRNNLIFVLATTIASFIGLAATLYVFLNEIF